MNQNIGSITLYNLKYNAFILIFISFLIFKDVFQIYRKMKKIKNKKSILTKEKYIINIY